MSKKTLNPDRDHHCKKCRRPIRAHNKSGYCSSCFMMIKDKPRKGSRAPRKLSNGSKQCKAIISSGKRCRHGATFGDYCVTHYSKLIKPKKKKKKIIKMEEIYQKYRKEGKDEGNSK